MLKVVNAARDRVGEYEFRELEHEEKMKRATKKILKDKNLHVGMIMLLSNLYQAAGEPVGSGMRGGETTQTIDWTWIVFVVCAALGASSTMKWLWDYTKNIFLGILCGKSHGNQDPGKRRLPERKGSQRRDTS